jgi:hypothetical protein
MVALPAVKVAPLLGGANPLFARCGFALFFHALASHAEASIRDRPQAFDGDGFVAIVAEPEGSLLQSLKSVPDFQ